MSQLPAETSAEGQTGNIPTGKALKGTKCEIQLPSSSSTPQSASLLPGVEPWTPRMPPQDTRKGKPLSTARAPAGAWKHLLLPPTIPHLQAG